MTPLGSLLEGLLAVGGLTILALIAKGLMSSHAWGDGAEYEMLDMDVSERELEGTADSGSSTITPGEGDGGPNGHSVGSVGTLGIADRVCRFGLAIAMTYLSFTWFGRGSPAMWFGIIFGGYATVTFLVGRDPIYRRLGISSKMLDGVAAVGDARAAKD